MELAKQVCSLELAKKLKELGVKQESYFMWVKYSLWDKPNLWQSDIDHKMKTMCLSGKREYAISAFTVAELGEKLPFGVMTIHIDTRFNKDYAELKGGNWFCRNETRGKRRYLYAFTEANARAKMRIYLLELEKKENTHSKE